MSGKPGDVWWLGLRREAGSSRGLGASASQGATTLDAGNAVTHVADLESELAQAGRRAKLGLGILAAAIAYSAAMSFPVVSLTWRFVGAAPSMVLALVAGIIGCAVLIWPLLGFFVFVLPGTHRDIGRVRAGLFRLTVAAQADDSVRQAVVGALDAGRAPALHWLSEGDNDLAKSLRGHAQQAHQPDARQLD